MIRNSILLGTLSCGLLVSSTCPCGGDEPQPSATLPLAGPLLESPPSNLDPSVPDRDATDEAKSATDAVLVAAQPSESKSEERTTDTPREAEAALDAENHEKEDPAEEADAPKSVSANSQNARTLDSEPSEKKTQNTLEGEGVDTDTLKKAPPKRAIKMTPQLLKLRNRLRLALAFYYQRPENAASRSPWGVMHAMLPYGIDAQVIVNRRRMSSIGYLCYNGPCRGQRMFNLRNDELTYRVGPGYQGHEGQLLAMLAQSRVRSDYPLKVQGRELTIQDLINYEKGTCKDGTELTFKLIGLTHYLDTDATWMNNMSQEWDMPRLIREELKQSVVGAACGGTHRMMGFAYAVKKRAAEQKPMEGQWARAEQYVDDYQQYTFRLQNRDGSFSTKWFEGRGSERDIDRRLQTTGHILEWLIYSLPPEELARPQVVRAVNYLTKIMTDYRKHEWEVGPRGHALRALALYDQLVFGAKAGERTNEFARIVRTRRMSPARDVEDDARYEARRGGLFRSRTN